jgi:hypothetical protein
MEQNENFSLPELSPSSYLEELMRNSDMIWKAMDRKRSYRSFAVVASQTLGETIDARVAMVHAGGDLAGINKLFERVDNYDLAMLLTDWIDRLATIETASEYVAGNPMLLPYYENTMRMVSMIHPEAIVFIQSVLKHVALITLYGYAHIVETHRDEQLADDWIKLWRYYLIRQNTQEADKSNLAGKIPSENQFEPGVRAYLSAFGDTGALGPAIIGALPHSPHFDREFLEIVCQNEVLPNLIKIYRLAQDINCDLEERVNAGLYGVSSMWQLSIDEAREWLSRDPQMRVSINSDLYRYWHTHVDQNLHAAHAFVGNVQLESEVARQALHRLIGATETVTNQIVEYKMTDYKET